VSAEAHASIFDRVLCGIDETPESLEAVRQGVRLRRPGGALHLFAAVYLAGAVAAGWSAPRIAEELERESGDALRRAREIAGPGTTSRLVNGPAVRSLLREVVDERATLLCVGSHGHRRVPGILFDYVSTTMLHEAPTAVLVAREPPDADAFPREIVVGDDGSQHAAAARAAADELVARLGASLTRVTADEHPVEALLEAAADADLLVVGSRGVHGVRALGSVSERVAHRAECSVLVVRGPGIGEQVLD
jgi:nucleotide-binding universal stress UspA family protein